MTPLRATTHLAYGANQLFDGWISTLRESGINIHGSVSNNASLDADVVFACGLLTATRIRDGQALSVVAAPLFANETSAVYRSVIVARQDKGINALEPGGMLRLAVNEYGSWSGWHGFKEYLRLGAVPSSAIGEIVESGGHASSIDAVLDDCADVASIDHSVWEARLLVDPRLKVLSVIATTRNWPAPPISVRSTLPMGLRNHLKQAITALPGIVTATQSDYAFMLAEVDEHPTWP